MTTLTHASFELVSTQASIYTPDFELDSSSFMRAIYPQWASTFDADPTLLPAMPGLPREVPRISLQSRTKEWLCEVASGRINIIWRRASPTTEVTSMADFLRKASEFLLRYKEFTGTRVGRLAALASRSAVHENPGLFLARHFCKSRWDTTPLNRPQGFELHAHKVFLMGDKFEVNSWARSKTGTLSSEGTETPVVVFEQDINTLAPEAETRSFDDAEIATFYSTTERELDHILSLYYPSEEDCTC